MRPWVFVLLGVLLIAGGVLAFANPFAASVAVTTIVGFFFVVGGVLQLWMAFSDAGDRHRLWDGILGALGLAAGISLLVNPLGGLIALTALLGVLFLLSGLARLVLAWTLRETPFFWVLLATGAISVVLAVMIFGNFADAAASLLGIVLGVQLLMEGIALVALGIAARRLG